MNEKIARFFAEQQPATPCLVVDLDIVEENFRSLTAALPDAKIYYAVKANPAPEILARLAALGSLVRRGEPGRDRDGAGRRRRRRRGSPTATPSRRRRDIARAYRLGVRLFAFDSEAELAKIAASAPGAASSAAS